MSQWLAFGNICHGFALIGLGRQMEGISQFQIGLTAWNGIGAHLLDTQFLGLLAEAQVQAGQFDDARAALDRAAETTAETGSGFIKRNWTG